MIKLLKILGVSLTAGVGVFTVALLSALVVSLSRVFLVKLGYPEAVVDIVATCALLGWGGFLGMLFLYLVRVL